MTRTLDIWWDGRLVGQLTQDKHGELGFAYAPAWLDDAAAQPLSASLPKRAESFTRRECRPFFGGLLPEEGQREAAAQALGVSRANDFALLDRLGGDVAGALQLLPPGEVPATLAPDQRPTPLDDAGLIRVLDALPVRPLLAGEEGLRLSLAGAQSKVQVVLVDGALALPRRIFSSPRYRASRPRPRTRPLSCALRPQSASMSRRSKRAPFRIGRFC
jgi:serine/threonine-protein kinase HipA